jgi:hypothetical protein
VYDSEGVWDGALPELPADALFEDAAARLEQFVWEHWRQWLDSRWVQDKPDWWSAGPAPSA